MLHYGCEDVEVAKEDFYTKGIHFQERRNLSDYHRKF